MKSVAVGVVTWVLAVAAMGAAHAAPDTEYEAALDRYYELTIGQTIRTSGATRMVEGFRTGASGKAKEYQCPKLDQAVDTFAEQQLRPAVEKYLASPELREQLEAGLRRHLTIEDLRAFLAFAQTPAGARYVEHSRLAEAEAAQILEASAEDMLQHPELKGVLGEFMVALMPVMLECQKKQK